MLPFLFDYKLGKCGGDEFRSVVVVVPPLVSLLTEQVRKLQQCGVSCAILAVGTGGSSYGSERCARELLVTSTKSNIKVTLRWIWPTWSVPFEQIVYNSRTCDSLL